MVKKLLQLFIGVVYTQLLKGVQLEKIQENIRKKEKELNFLTFRMEIDVNDLFQCLVSSPHHQSYLKDLKPSDVQDADERGSLSLSAVQSSVDAVH